ALSRPESRDSPILPTPRMATRRGSSAIVLSLGGSGCGQRHQPAAEAHQEVDAREPRPLLVRLDERRGLGGLDPAAAAERSDELDEAEVADEPALVAAKPFQADDTDRPRPEAALAQEAGPRRRRGG